ncbi:MAG: glutaredoxin family protein [Anaerolineae bacterium]
MTATRPLPIVMYASPTCEDSELARDRLRKLGIPFTEINVMRTQKQLTTWRA